ncbi:glycoside hydrolase [Streptomyces sp. TR1341]|uniref:Cell wall-associated NlpC family hydrolase n=1 Tax=Streptomyces murinus TaxID=33900 RepID=A0A7W3NR77_STRMR|nr:MULTISPECIES: C40 family peptidase [Streptomyces]NDK26483.1 glycoside hydrolase [Streptomyces sp. TR1341]MBA9055254.1 cell wall-associated NlpC family hydrolase [Streptomyces murinus]UWW89853.1 glycoside hydrolase [Streptomyces murinus]WSI87066.1 NlpC/P60 family protein [Streptomyces murinus]WUD08708.1 NlpC/P60 family protein [Streptomyces murinus]
MSHTAHIRSHRKPRRSASSLAMRTGVAGGVLSTLAVAGAAGSANAAEPVTQTLELPTLTADLATQAAQSADATQQAAANYQLQAERDAAAAKAAKQAKADLADAKQKAAEAKKKAEEAARKEAAERASRSTTRIALTADDTSGSTSASTGTSTGSSTATGSAAAVISFVKAQLGKAYVSGATGPSAYDCSGLVQTAFKQVGVSLPRVSQDQSTAGTQVSLSNLQPGDILYWGSAGSAYHVAVYVGDGMFIGAQNPSSGVSEHPLSYDQPTGAVRVL